MTNETEMREAEETEREAESHLIEECSEVIKVITKAQRFGWFDIHPRKGKMNIVLLGEELNDVMRAADKFYEVGGHQRHDARARLGKGEVEAVRDAVIDRAEQACRYALKHQNFSDPLDDKQEAARQDGWEVAVHVCENAIRRHVLRHWESDNAALSSKPKEAMDWNYAGCMADLQSVVAAYRKRMPDDEWLNSNYPTGAITTKPVEVEELAKLIVALFNDCTEKQYSIDLETEVAPYIAQGIIDKYNVNSKE